MEKKIPKANLDQKLIDSMSQWFTDRGIFERVQKLREEKAEQQENAS